jgi:GntR family transcriptional regulator, transcriptional repressor for pyruvate dehydrogenase complex
VLEDLYDDIQIFDAMLATASSLQATDRPSDRLSDRLASLLRERIESGEWAPGHRLPTEQSLTVEYRVSRTVVREAVSRLKSTGWLTSRQGSGMFVAAAGPARALVFDPAVLRSLTAVLQVVEVRRSLEGEVAALAAARITPAKGRQLEQALAAIDEAVEQGRDGVEEDLHFHRTIARITDNPQFEGLLDFLEQYLRDAIHVTRANEAMHREFMRQVRAEHQAIVRAICKGDAAAARRAAVRHMVNAEQRIERADESVRAALGQVLQQAGNPSSKQRKRAS